MSVVSDVAKLIIKAYLLTNGTANTVGGLSSVGDNLNYFLDEVEIMGSRH